MKKINQIVLAIILSSSVMFALDMQTYYDLDYKAMEITLHGKAEIVKCIENKCPVEEQYALYATMQEKTDTLYKVQGTTLSKCMGYYAKHRVEAEDFYKNSPKLQNKYKTIMQKLDSVNSALNPAGEN